MKKKTLVLTLMGIIIISAAITFAIKYNPQGCPICQTDQPVAIKPTEQKVTDFFSCAAKTGLVMESYPRQCRYNQQLYTEDIGNELEKTAYINISSPRPNQIISSPLNIAGQAVGSWFFEGDMPIKLLDDNNNDLVNSYVTAQSEWMTDSFVNYSGTIEFETPDTDGGLLIIMKDNPSGLAEHDDQLEIPVRFR